MSQTQVQSGFIGNNSVTSAQIATDAVTTAKISSGAVTTAKIADGNVTTAKISSGAVTTDKLDSTVSTSLVPTGAVFHFAASTAPAGYLKANGDTIPNGSGTVQGVTANFSALYAILGSTYGSAGRLPDLRGEFIRGWDDARGVDSGRTIGSSQLGSRTYVPINLPPGDTAPIPSYHQPNAPSPVASFFDQTVTGGYTIDPAFGVSKRFASTGTGNILGTVRPRNIALLACIKY
jgi:hypothetical protein